MKKSTPLFLILFLFFLTGCSSNSHIYVPEPAFNQTVDIQNNSIPVEITKPLDSQGILKVRNQEITSDIIDYYLRRTIRNLTFDGTQTLNSRNITVLDASLIDIDNIIRVQEGSRLFQSEIKAINGNTLTLRTPLDYPYTSNADVSEAQINMNVDGSGTPVIFSLEPSQQSTWHITRIICGMEHTSGGDNSKFGDLPALENGVIFRQTNGIQHTFFNARTNGMLKLRAYDLEYDDKVGGGNHGTFIRRSFGGEDKNGAVIELNPFLNESFEVVIQDDLTSLLNYNCVLQGHIKIP